MAPIANVEEGVGLGEALRLLKSSRHLQIISIVIAFAAIGNSIIDQQLNMAAAASKGTDTDLVTFLAEITFYLSLAGFVVQVGLTSQIHRSFGLVFALLVLPVSLGSTAVAILVTGSLWAPSLAKVLDSSLRYSLDKTDARDPVPAVAAGPEAARQGVRGRHGGSPREGRGQSCSRWCSSSRGASASTGCA